ncbi:threonine dehydratase biosynthetic protein [Artemisia annua]|uniref:Threonine dehydratase biosynthetic protein n=1 Tax=Artemisia annua TaxID=35608 RepID=A0A2U1MSF8_ARTAN|nr:threonine dehydratase biosynthetic protein [Artemisia annua]
MGSNEHQGVSGRLRMGRNEHRQMGHRHLMTRVGHRPRRKMFLPQFRSFQAATLTAISTSSTSSYTTKDAVSVVANPRKELPQFSPDSLRYEQGKVGAVPDGRVSESSVGAMEYLTSILTSKVYDVAVESPLQHASKLSGRLDVNIWLKREDLQPFLFESQPSQHHLRALTLLKMPSALSLIHEKNCHSSLRIPYGMNKFSPDSLQYEQGKVGAVPDGRVSESSACAMEYLTSMLTSKVYDVAVESPLQHASKLSERLGVNIWLKREDLQPTSMLTSKVYDVKVESTLQHASKLSERLGVNIWLKREDLPLEPCQMARISESSVGAMEYLTSILTSKVYDVAVESPLQHAAKLSERLGVNIWLKREDLPPVSSCYNLE